jgi:putative spermidine/putrescine transport system permease protein
MPPRSTRVPSTLLLALPAIFLIGCVYLGAIVTVVLQSFQTYTPGRIVQTPFVFTFDNYATYVFDPRYFGFLWTTLSLGSVATVISVIVAYPVAFAVVRANSRNVRKILLTLVILSFFSNPVATTFGWYLILSPAGVVNTLFKSLQIHAGDILGTGTAVVLGLVYYCTPIAVLVLLGPIRNIEHSFEEAARSLGASRLSTLLRVTLPLSLPGLVAAGLLNFALNVSAFLNPLILGGGRITFLSDLIFDRYASSLNFPGGAAQAVELTVIGLVLVFGFTKLLGTLVKGYEVK